MGMDNSFMIRLLDPILDKFNGFGDNYPLICLTITSSDLGFAVSVFSEFISKTLKRHWVATKGILRYPQGTLGFGIKYTDSFDVRVTRFSNSYWAGKLDDCRSIEGYAFNIVSGVIAWSNKNKNIVCLSSVEAKYHATCAATCEEVWLRRLLHGSGEKQNMQELSDVTTRA